MLLNTIGIFACEVYEIPHRVEILYVFIMIHLQKYNRSYNRYNVVGFKMATRGFYTFSISIGHIPQDLQYLQYQRVQGHSLRGPTPDRGLLGHNRNPYRALQDLK